MTYDEEMVSLHQFLRFGETKSIVELMAIQEKEGNAVVVPTAKSNSDIRAFIENNNQTRNSSLSTHLEKVNPNSIHHFEKIVNNLAFMLPFQFFNPIQMPLLGTSPNSFLLDQSQEKLRETKQEMPIPMSKSFLVSTDVDSFQSTEENSQSSQDKITRDLKNDSTNDSSVVTSPSLSVTPNQELEQAQLHSHVSKVKAMDKPGSLTIKGRVYCSACEKTFYDKGTLKIHYNAVHLKIKHKCTVEGCNMVFSSLRSRNRHSSNPNPRLHMPTMKNSRDKDLRNCSLATVIQVNSKRFDVSNCSGTDSRSLTGFENPRSESNVQSNAQNAGHGAAFPNLKTVQPVLPFYRSLVSPAEIAIPQAALPPLPHAAASVQEQIPAREPVADPVPKKKSRKSSMPVKIEIETMEELEDPESGVSNCDRAAQLGSDNEFKDMKYDLERTGSGASYLSDVEEQAPKLQQPDVITADAQAINSGKSGIDPHHLENSDPYMKAKTVILSSYGDEQRESETDTGESLLSKSEGWLQADLLMNDYKMQYRLINGDFSRALMQQKARSLGCGSPTVNGCTCPQPDADHEDNQGTSNPNYCYVCKKVFKSSYSVKLHYKNVHLKEMHMCTVGGCNAAFPSRRSRDRHSANINLHHKLLTKGSYETQNNFFHSTPLSKELCEDLLARTQMVQTPVLLKGKNGNERFGFSLHGTQEPSIEAQGGDGFYSDTVLDLSTTSSVKSGSSIHSWDSDAGSEEGVPVNGDEGFERADTVAKDKLYQLSAMVDEPIDCLLQSPSTNSPIMCNVCQKMYSNKGTFRAHYKTVHLRQLHKCKVLGCNTMFSSVRSRNRHSQNPNLHKEVFCSSNENH
ncbi:zinc finger protein basonuclin-1 isoform X2 [Narcine bancroftii]